MMAYFDPNFHSLEEYIVPPPTVEVDNDTYEDRTVVKVHGVKRHGLLLAIAQALTDLDLLISKANIASDGEWIMNAFHVTDELGNKLTEPAQIRYIEDSLLFAEGRGGDACRPPDEVRTCLNNLVGAGHLASDHAIIEMTVSADHRGLLSEVLTTILAFHFEVSSGVAWTHNGRAGFIFSVIDSRRPDSPDPARLAELEAQLRRVVEADWHGGSDQRWQLRISGPSPDRAHAERRLHQIMREDSELQSDGTMGSRGALQSAAEVTAVEMEVAVNDMMEKKKKKKNHKNKYMVEVSVRSRDRPKLLFDMACTLEDLEYEVVHASVSTEGGVSVQEYYIMKRDRWSRATEMELERLVESLAAAAERRPGPSLGMIGVEVEAVEYRNSMLSEMARVFRENGMWVVGAKWAKRGDSAAGVFYLSGGSATGDEARGLMRALRVEIGGCNFAIKEGGRTHTHDAPL